MTEALKPIQAADAFAEAYCRIESLIYVPAAVWDEDSYPEVFGEDFCDGLPEREDARLWKQLPELARYAGGEEWPEAGEVAWHLRRVDGFLVKAATPVAEFGKSGHAYMSWGYYHTEWLYAARAEDIQRVAIEWANDTRAKDKAKADLARSEGQ